MVHTILLLLALIGLLGAIGYLLAGWSGSLFSSLAGIYLLTFRPHSGLDEQLRQLQAAPLPLHYHPQLNYLVHSMIRRAELSSAPRFYHIDRPEPNAFAIGTKDQAAIVLTDALLKNLNSREIAGIIGHELAHIRNNDLQVLASADAIRRTLHSMATFAQILLLVLMPLAIVQGMTIPLMPLLLLVFAPSLGALLQLAISRTREFEADRTGAALAKDVFGLASALRKLETAHTNMWRQMVPAPWQIKPPLLLRSHPPTNERVQRLKELGCETGQWPRHTELHSTVH